MEGLEYGVSLVDHMSGPAMAAAKSVGTLSSELTTAKKTLASYQSQVASAKTGDVGGFGRLTGLVSSAKSGLSSLRDEASTIGPVLSEIGSKGGAALGAIGAAAGIALAGITALAVGLGRLAYEGAHLAIEQVELREELISGFEAFGSFEGAGEKTLEMVDRMSSVLPQSRKQLADWTNQFMALGVTDLGELRSQLTSAASAAALIKGGGDAYLSLAKKIQIAIDTSQGLKIPTKGLGSLAAMGVRVEDVAERMGVSTKVLATQLENGTADAQKFGNALQEALEKKGAGPLDNMRGDLETIITKGREGFGKLFSGINIEPFMKQLAGLAHLFDESTTTGKAMKLGVTGAFNAIFSIAAKVVPYVKYFFVELIILSLRAYIFLRKHWTEIRTTFLTVAKGVGLVGAIIAGSLAMIAAPAIFALGAVTALGAGIAWLIGKALDLENAAMDAGRNFVAGLVGGITAGYEAVKSAAVGLGQSAMDGVKSVLGIASPSKMMLQFGAHTSGGFARGIRGGMGETVSASKEMGEGAIEGATQGVQESRAAISQSIPAGAYDRRGKEAPSISSSPGKSTSIQGISITIQAPSGVTNALELTEVAVAALFERLALQQGM